jgi:hypothetical protein
MRKIAIVGGGERNPPFSDLTIEIWTIGRLCGSAMPRVTRAYELHGEGVYKHYVDHLAKVVLAGAELWMLDPELVPGAKRLPGPAIVAAGGGFIANSISWMLAHALYEGRVARIELHGTPMSGQQYLYERPSVLYYVGLLRGRGIEVVDCSRIVNWATCYGVVKNGAVG